MKSATFKAWKLVLEEFIDDPDSIYKDKVKDGKTGHHIVYKHILTGKEVHYWNGKKQN